MNFYNEIDPNAAAWLRELIARKLIPAGVVDERSITEIKADEIRHYTQCHFFCGIAGWPLALALAGVPDHVRLWTGSCPCQPFSSAGKGLGTADERHLWPAFFNLIRQCRPERVFGEQVASAIGHGWLDGISADLESEGYACGASVLGAHSVGAPHIRQRLYWVANSKDPDWRSELEAGRTGGGRSGFAGSGPTGRLGDRPSGGCGIERDAPQPGSGGHPDGSGRNGGVAYSQRDGSTPRLPEPPQRKEGESGELNYGGGECAGRVGISDRDGRQPGSVATAPPRYGNPADSAGFWNDSIWHPCRDGKHRRIPTQPALFPLADGLPYKLARRGSVRPALLKGAGNAIVPQVAAEFIAAAMMSMTNPQQPLPV